MVTLSLFRTILSFHCEDVMYELIFKHLLTLNHLDPGKLDTSNGLHKTYLTGSALCLSSNKTTTQPKLLWSASPRLNSISAMKHTTYYHPTVDQLVPGLVKSAELFLSLANTSCCNDKSSRSRHRSAVNNSEVDTSLKDEKKKKSSNSKEVIYTGSGSCIPTTDPLTSLSLSKNYTDSADNDDNESNLNETLNNEWVVIRSTVHPILLTNNYPKLINYIKNANLRVSRRRQACQSWHSEYWPKMLENNSNRSPPIRDDNLLDLQEKQSRFDLHRKVTSKYTTNGCTTPDFLLNPLSTKICDKSTSDIVDTCDKNEGLDPLSSPLLLHSLSNKHTSSLYQLNYLNDSSDDENNQENMKQVKNSNTTDNDNNNNTDSSTIITPFNTVSVVASNCVQDNDTVDETATLFNKHLSTEYSSESFYSQMQMSQLSTTLKANNQKEEEYNPKNDDLNENVGDCDIGSSCTTGMSYIPPSVNSMPPCTCLSTLPDLLRLAHLDPSIEIHNHQNSNNTILSTTKLDFNERQEYELENFLAALDCLPSPGRCTKHFGHLPPFISYSKIDDEFFKKLDNYVQELEDSKVNTAGTDIIRNFSSTSSTHSARHNSNSIGVAGGIGPFLSILLNRLANMHNNCFFTNLLLTDIFAALASYPCPLLYEFLLNPVGLSVKSSVNTLYKVLRSVRSQIVVASESVEQWKSLVFRARVYLNIVWPGPFKMTIDPNFYTTKDNSQRIKAKTVGRSNTTNTNSSSKRDRDNSSSHSTNSNDSSLNYSNKDSFQHIVPLLPKFIYILLTYYFFSNYITINCIVNFLC
ncbi:FTS and Hook-interacting protein-like protein [Schistosoma japonicum]|nr:FTS and Hook-interacting protein-like protein [Schistosoma japonicum]